MLKSIKVAGNYGDIDESNQTSKEDIMPSSAPKRLDWSSSGNCE